MMRYDACPTSSGTQQKGGGGLVYQTFLAFHCNHIKLNSPKKGGGRRGAE